MEESGVGEAGRRSGRLPSRSFGVRQPLYPDIDAVFFAQAQASLPGQKLVMGVGGGGGSRPGQLKA